MKLLHKGQQSAVRLAALIKLSGITSDEIIGALEDYLVKGMRKTVAARLNQVPPGNLTRALDALEVVAAEVEVIKEDDWARNRGVV